MPFLALKMKFAGTFSVLCALVMIILQQIVMVGLLGPFSRIVDQPQAIYNTKNSIFTGIDLFTVGFPVKRYNVTHRFFQFSNKGHWGHAHKEVLWSDPEKVVREAFTIQETHSNHKCHTFPNHVIRHVKMSS